MKLLIDNLLEYSRVRSLGAPLERIDSRQSLQDALDNLHSTIDQRQAMITSEGLSEVIADPSQLTQALSEPDRQRDQILRQTAASGPHSGRVRTG